MNEDDDALDLRTPLFEASVRTSSRVPPRREPVTVCSTRRPCRAAAADES
jgi:hypothetical protein